MGIMQKIFGTYSERELKRIYPIQKKVLDLEEKYRAMSDEELKACTPALKERLANGETLDDILPDAFAVCRDGAFPGADHRRHCAAPGADRRDAHR